ncbi:MAG: GNAT family N-acetyltransferase [Erysipelotrichaceae bacterium]|nr:GNAT family N-acetyltransferase [Erysipelotrichaceae bacterium]
MTNVYSHCPEMENDRFRLRPVRKKDAEDLLKVYSDRNALPFFNSDNCHGDNFYYPTLERMEQAIDFWLSSYENGWFVRWSVIDKTISQAIGTIEVFRRQADDDFNDVGVLRLDVRSDYERAEILEELLRLFVPQAYELFGCREIITKVPLYALERLQAAQRAGFEKSESLLIGTYDHYPYNNYWMIRKSR